MTTTATNQQLNNTAAQQYLSDVYDSDPGAGRDYLIGLVAKTFAMTPAEASEVYRAWLREE